MRSLHAITVPAVLSACLLVGCKTRPDPQAERATPEPYMRLVQATNQLEMQLAAREFKAQRGKAPGVWLVGVSHLGESNYFEQVQSLLKDKTVVLFEGIGFDEAHQRASGAPAPENTHASLQTKLAQSLGLEFQLEAMDYDQPNFQNSDLTVADLQRLMESAPGPGGGKESLDTLLETMQGGQGTAEKMMNFGLGLIGSSPKLRSLAKLTLLEMLAALEGDITKLASFEPGLGPLLDTLIQKRNERVIADLEEQAKRLSRRDSVAVLYGAGHMADFETRLRSAGYTPRKQVWLTAMSVETGPNGVSEMERALLKGMIQAQMKNPGAQARTNQLTTPESTAPKSPASDR